MTEEAQQEKIGEWRDATKTINGLHCVAEQAVNLSFALFDPAKYDSETVGPFIPDGEEPTGDDLAYAFMAGGFSYETERKKNCTLFSRTMRRSQTRSERKTQDFRVYHKDDRTVILKVGLWTADSFLSIDDTTPGEYADKGPCERADAPFDLTVTLIIQRSVSLHSIRYCQGLCANLYADSG